MNSCDRRRIDRWIPGLVFRAVQPCVEAADYLGLPHTGPFVVIASDAAWSSGRSARSEAISSAASCCPPRGGCCPTLHVGNSVHDQEPTGTFPPWPAVLAAVVAGGQSAGGVSCPLPICATPFRPERYVRPG